MLKTLRRIFGKPTARTFAPVPKLLITADCIEAIRAGLAPATARRHEGIAYLLGRTDGLVTMSVAVFCPEAITTMGSFKVPAVAMAAVVETASSLNLQVVGQIHTHPGQAYHSDGDVEGARIRYAGYVSLVLPNYGAALPNLTGLAAYIWHNKGWHPLSANDITIIRGAGPWTATSGSTSATVGRSGIAIVV